MRACLSRFDRRFIWKLPQLVRNNADDCQLAPGANVGIIGLRGLYSLVLEKNNQLNIPNTFQFN